MNELSINFENCYGIKKLKHTFLFSQDQKAHLIYAPNGTMKTSFAKTMRYLSGQTKQKPIDQLNVDKKPINEVIIDGNMVNSKDERFFVVNGEDNINSSEAFVNFLASSELKGQYDNIYYQLSNSVKVFFKELKRISQSTDCQTELLETFGDSNDTIFVVLEKLDSKLKGICQKTGSPVFYNFKYNDIFDKKGNVRKFVENHQSVLKDYIERYNKLLGASVLYRKEGVYNFGTYHANQILKDVSDGNFFGVGHKLMINNHEEPIKTHEEFKSLIEEERSKIINDEELKKKFDKITAEIDKNSELREFKKVIEANPEWINEIVDYDNFRKLVWYGFIAKNEVKKELDEFMIIYHKYKEELDIIIDAANKETDKWKQIIDLYNARFIVPFRVEIENQKEIILNKKAARLKFSYEYEGEFIPKEEAELDKILSRGEKRAFVILQFIFEMESRIAQKHDCLIVMDDIADSFDYQNKYAIVEYMKDLVNEENVNFYLLVLTHNYDFYRTVASRLFIKRDHLWMIDIMTSDEIKLHTGQYVNNVFTNYFINNTHKDEIFISIIPFVRELVKYTKGGQSQEYEILTNCLHLKEETRQICKDKIIDIFNCYNCGKTIKKTNKDSTSTVYRLIMTTECKISKDKKLNPVDLENKIVLSIAIRLIAEEYLSKKLLEAGKTTKELETFSSQTSYWTDLYKKNCPNDPNITIIERVNMMTPELIHINSFMFEPLIDMSISHLISLYNDCINQLQ